MTFRSQCYISAAHKSSGKTTLTLGLCQILQQRKIHVQAFKKGPDYIDPAWLGKASGQPCINLDFYTSTNQEIQSAFHHYATGADAILVEGNKGLYDGLALDGSNSNAALAKLLGLPVVLVIDVQGITRGVAPLLLGYQQFDPAISIAGVIFNQVGGARHEQKLRAATEHYTQIPVLGAVHKNPDFLIPERHLGLRPANEDAESIRKIKQIAQHVEAQVDIEQFLAVTQSPLEPVRNEIPATIVPGKPIKIGIARDAAFGFYYQDDLDRFEALGAELVPFDTLNDTSLPEVDGLFIGGGFPETLMAELAKNQSLQKSIAAKINNGLPTYAECGGMMYLCESIIWETKTEKMVGVIPAQAVMQKKPQGRGYVQLKETAAMPWLPQGNETPILHAHEFHYSYLQGLPDTFDFAYDIVRGTGIKDKKDGLLYKNLLACYAHLRDKSQNHWVDRFVNFVRNRIDT